MPDAFAHAMMEQLRDPSRPVYFEMRVVDGGYGSQFPCSHFLELREEEKKMLGKICDSAAKPPRVLDIGCGIGRHLKFVRERMPDAELTGVEISEVLRDYCCKLLPNGRFLHCVDALPGEEPFDLVLLMGNGLGIFGNEDSAKQGLRRVFDLLIAGGALMVESGNPFRANGYDCRRHEIRYGQDIDGPFDGGYASEVWIRQELETIGYAVKPETDSLVGRGGYFICWATR